MKKQLLYLICIIIFATGGLFAMQGQDSLLSRFPETILEFGGAGAGVETKTRAAGARAGDSKSTAAESKSAAEQEDAKSSTATEKLLEKIGSPKWLETFSFRPMFSTNPEYFLDEDAFEAMLSQHVPSKQHTGERDLRTDYSRTRDQQKEKETPFSEQQRRDYFSIIVKSPTIPLGKFSAKQVICSDKDTLPLGSKLTWAINTLYRVINKKSPTVTYPEVAYDYSIKEPFKGVLLQLLAQEGLPQQQIDEILLQSAIFDAGMAAYRNSPAFKLAKWKELAQVEKALFKVWISSAQPLINLFNKLYKMLPAELEKFIRRSRISPEDLTYSLDAQS